MTYPSHDDATRADLHTYCFPTETCDRATRSRWPVCSSLTRFDLTRCYDNSMVPNDRMSDYIRMRARSLKANIVEPRVSNARQTIQMWRCQRVKTHPISCAIYYYYNPHRLSTVQSRTVVVAFAMSAIELRYDVWCPLHEACMAYRVSQLSDV